MALGKKELIAPNFKGTKKGLYEKLVDSNPALASEELLYD